MAIILKSGARAGQETAVAALPLRSTTIKILQTGLIQGIVNEAGDFVSIVNMGYLGDNYVSRIYVELWKNAISFEGYDAALVFYNTYTRTRRTLDMSHNGTKFYLDIPEAITLEPHGYQVYFILRERVDLEDNIVTDAVGVEDDPAYREVFVSDVCPGIVEPNSGRQYISSDFDWNNNIHNYNIGAISVDDKVWNYIEATSQYTTSLYLGGLNFTDTEAFSGNVAVQAETASHKDINVTYQSEKITNVTTSLDTKTLTLNVVFAEDATSEDIEAALDGLKITYPVVFVATLTDNLKKPIRVVHNAHSVSVEDNTRLGMKYDAYVTPINTSGLISPYLSSGDIISKYVIFEQYGRVYVCKSDSNDFCWIPAGVTEKPGQWNVSFAVRNETTDYVYYTGLLSLPVVDNALFKEDIDTDSTYAATLDINGSYLYDGNDYVIYSQTESQSQGRLNFKWQDINNILGWANGIAELNDYDPDPMLKAVAWAQEVSDTENGGYSAEKVKQQLNKVSTLDQSVTDINQIIEDVKLTDMRNEVDLLNTQLDELTPRVAAAEANIVDLKTSLAAADVTKLSGRVDEISENVNSLIGKTNSIENDYKAEDVKIRDEYKGADQTLKEELIAQYKNADQLLANQIDDVKNVNSIQELAISTNAKDIGSLKVADATLQGQIVAINSTLADYGYFTSGLLQEVEDRANADRDLKEQIEKIYEKDVLSGKEEGILIDKEEDIYKAIDGAKQAAASANSITQQAIDGEVGRAKGAESDLGDAIAEEYGRAFGEEEKLRQEIADINTDITKNIKTDIEALKLADQGYDNEIQSHTGRLNSVETQLNTSVIRNEYTLGVEKTYVAKIIFLKSEAEYEALENKDPNTLYLIQEEE